MSSTLPFLTPEAHGIATRPERQRVSAQSDPWCSLYSSSQCGGAHRAGFKPSRDQLLVLHRSGPARIERFEGGRWRAVEVPAGCVHIYPGGLPLHVRLPDEADTLQIYLRRSVIEEVAAELASGDPADVDIPPQLSENDPLLRCMLDAAQVALSDEEPALPMFIDHLARAMASHLVRRYSDKAIRETDCRCLGTDLTRALDYMRCHLVQPLTLTELAREVGCSPGHLGRIFRERLGTPPHAYLIEMRLQKALGLLKKASMPIATIAAQCGFAHQEHLTRLFRRRFQTTPAAWRRALLS
jgi:AraC family transcriptional regulator